MLLKYCYESQLNDSAEFKMFEVDVAETCRQIKVASDKYASAVFKA